MTSKSIVETVADNIRKYRKGLSLAKIARKGGIPVATLETIYYRQKKINDIKASTLISISKALNISIDILVGLKK